MRRFIVTGVFLTIGLLVSAQSFAQPAKGGGQQGFMQRLPVLAALDKDKDGTISKEEIANASETLGSLDANEDGQIDSSEMMPAGGFGGGRGQGARGQGGKGGRGKGVGKGKGGGGKGGKGGGKGGGAEVGAKVFDFLKEKYDKDGDGKISPEEHNRGDELFASLDKDGDKYLTAKDWEVDAPRAKRPNRDLVAPVVGAVAPDFELTLAKDAKKTVKLSSFAGDKPVALIFGSCS